MSPARARTQTARVNRAALRPLHLIHTKGAFVWDQSGIRIIGIMRVSVCFEATVIPEYIK